MERGVQPWEHWPFLVREPEMVVILHGLLFREGANLPHAIDALYVRTNARLVSAYASWVVVQVIKDLTYHP